MSSAEKFRVLTGAAVSASTKADRARDVAHVALVSIQELARATGYEAVREPVDETHHRIRYRRRLPRWLAWVRLLGFWS